MTIVAFISGAYLVIVAEKTCFWQKNTAMVTNISIKEFKQTHSIRNTTPTFTVVPEYTYTINGKSYTSDIYGYWQSLKSKFHSTQEALDWMQDSDYSHGSTITVFVNPNNLSQSVVIKGANIVAYLPLLLGLFLHALNIYIKFSVNKNNKTSLKPLYRNNVS